MASNAPLNSVGNSCSSFIYAGFAHQLGKKNTGMVDSEGHNSSYRVCKISNNAFEMGCSSRGDREQQQREALNLPEAFPQETSQLISVKKKGKKEEEKVRYLHIIVDNIHIHFFIVRYPPS